MKHTITTKDKKPKDCAGSCKNVSQCEDGCVGYLGNNAEPVREYPDPMDQAKEKFLDEYMRGEH